MHRVGKIIVGGIVILELTAGRLFGQAGLPPSTPPWQIAGDLEEACSCSPACPCWFGSKPTRATCDGAQFLFLSQGMYGQVPVSGLAFGQVAQSPVGQSMMDSAGHWNLTVYYIDSRATPAQRVALEAIARVVFPPAGSQTAIRYVPIARSFGQGDVHTITFGNAGVISGHLVKGGLGGGTTIDNPPGADPIHALYQQGVAARWSYRDGGQTWNYAGTNYMRATFQVNSQQYQQWKAGLAQKVGPQR